MTKDKNRSMSARPFTSRISMRLVVPLVMVVPVLVVVSSLSVIVWFNGRAAANDLERQIFDQAGQRIQQRLTEFIEVPRQINELNAHLIRNGSLDIDRLESWRETLFQQIDAFETVSSIGFATPDRQTTWMVRYPGEEVYVWGLQNPDTGGLMVGRDVLIRNGEVLEETSNRYEYDPLTRPWYRVGVQNPGRHIWSRIYPWVGQRTEVPELGLGLVLTVHDDSGDLLGVHDTELSLTQISVFLSSLDISSGSTVYIVDDEQGMVASSTLAPLVREPDERVTARTSEDRRVRAIVEYLDAANSSAGAHNDFTLDHDGESLRVRVQPFLHPTGLDWSVWIAVPEADLWARTEAAQSQMIRTGIAATVLVLLLGYGLSLIVVRPLLRLVDQVRSIGDGDFNAHTEERLTSELSTLSASLNEMSEHLEDRMRLKQSIELAVEVQQNLLPASLPAVKGLDVYGLSVYCDETGGDYYDYFSDSAAPESSLGIAVGDVTGHGISAALLMATARATLRSRVHDSSSLSKLLEQTNEILVADTRGVNFMAMLLLVIDSKQRTLRWSSAGQNPPFVYNPDRQDFYQLSSGSLPLGVMHPTEYGEQMIHGLSTGSVIVAATDGLWEAQNRDGQPLGLDRVQQCISSNSDSCAEDIGRALIACIKQHRGQSVTDDDITLVVVKLTD